MTDPFGRGIRHDPDQPALAIETADDHAPTETVSGPPDFPGGDPKLDDQRAGVAPHAVDRDVLAEAVADALDVIAACETARAEALADVGRIAATRRAAIARVVAAAGGVNAAARALDMSPTVVSRAMKDDDA